MTTKLEKIRARVDNPPHWCEYAGLGLDADIPALLAVVDAAVEWLAADSVLQETSGGEDTGFSFGAALDHLAITRMRFDAAIALLLAEVTE